MGLRKCISLLLIICLILLPLESEGRKRHHHPIRHEPPLPAWCQTKGYSCLRVKSNQSWNSLFPDEVERDIVMRVNRTNGPLYNGMIITVPNQLNADVLDFSPFPRHIDPPNEKLIIVDLSENAWGAYDADGYLVKWGPATGGSDWCKDIGRSCRTKAGHFRIYSLGSSSCVSSKFPVPRGGAPMPFCMFFNGGQALHGSPGAVMRGNVSHGCVRLYVSDAEWLRYDFVEGPNESNHYRGTKIIVEPY
jgi:L,D-transpeptidase ErfK/SrfK